MVSPFDGNIWFFGGISRSEAELRLKDKRPGMFLIRESNTSRGSYVLCVSENSKVSHYIINKQAETNIFQIGDQTFTSLPDIIQFYKLHFLDTTTLIEPCPKGPIYHPQQSPSTALPPVSLPTTGGELFVALYDFKGKDEEDLPFSKGDKLLVISKDEDQWWTAVHTATGAKGAIPKPYVEKFIPSGSQVVSTGEMNTNTDSEPKFAIATQQRMPSAYDPTQLKLEVGDKIQIIKTHASGQWQGINETTGKTGSFPFTHVQVLKDNGENSMT
ncbi:crk-like protein [Antedon mediterranea]|uniref:crk-like protein n=1 Tax=Antedon mediterranea TaxID=105859 RepID=UPI003AF52B02